MSLRLATNRRLGWLAVIGGSLLALAVQFVAPVGVPLYDGFVVTEPYRFLHPTGDQAGQPTSYSDSSPVTDAVSPLVAGFTGESPPQAQLVAQADAFRLTAGVTSMKITIDPIEAPAPPAGSAIAGNVYRFAVTDQSGNPLATKTCDGCRSLLLRAPAGTGDASIGLYLNGAWTRVETLHAGTVDLYQSNVTALGDYAVITGGNAQPQPGDGGAGGLALDPLILLGGGAIIVWLVILAFVVRSRTRPEPIPGTRGAGGRGRIPSKRKAPRRPPPPGRSS